MVNRKVNEFTTYRHFMIYATRAVMSGSDEKKWGVAKRPICRGLSFFLFVDQIVPSMQMTCCTQESRAESTQQDSLAT